MFFFYFFFSFSKIFPVRPSLEKLKEREKRIDEFTKTKFRKKDDLDFIEKDEKKTPEEAFLALLDSIKRSQHNEKLPMLNNSKIISKKHEILKKKKIKRPKISVIHNKWNISYVRNISCDVNITAKEKSSLLNIPRNNPTSLSSDFPLSLMLNITNN